MDSVTRFLTSGLFFINSYLQCYGAEAGGAVIKLSPAAGTVITKLRLRIILFYFIKDMKIFFTEKSHGCINPRIGNRNKVLRSKKVIFIFQKLFI